MLHCRLCGRRKLQGSRDCVNLTKCEFSVPIRDISTSNIIVANGRGVLLDFHVAKCYDGSGSPLARTGKAAPFPPHNARSDPVPLHTCCS